MDTTSLNETTQSTPANNAPGFLPLVSRVLRWGGIATLIGAAVHFLFSDMLMQQPLLQYGTFLGFNLVLIAVGWFASIRWSDRAGGRALLGLAAAFVPAHMARLGGFIYAAMGYGTAAGTIEPVPALILTAVALPVLFGSIWLGFAALCRCHAKPLAVGFFAANALLLLPFRDPQLVALLASGGFLGLAWLHEKLRARRPFVGWDAAMLRLSLLAPFGIMVGRNLIHHFSYEESSFALATFSFGAIALVFMRGITPEIKRQGLRNFYRLVTVFFAFIAWVTFVFQAPFGFTLNDSNAWLFFVLPFLCGGILISAISSADESRWLRILFSLATPIVGLAVFGYGAGLTEALMVLGCGVGMAAVAFYIRERAVLIGAVILSIIGGVALTTEYIDHVPDVHWSILAAGGLVAVLAASGLERFQKRVRDRVSAFAREWN